MATALEQPMETGVRSDAAPVPRLAISARFLLGIYAIVPVCLAVMVIDRLFFAESIFRLLPDSPESFFIAQLVFGTRVGLATLRAVSSLVLIHRVLNLFHHFRHFAPNFTSSHSASQLLRSNVGTAYGCVRLNAYGTSICCCIMIYV